MENRNDLLVHVSELYYQQNLNQNDISKILGISRPTVSRLLEEARAIGIVEITVHSPVHKNSELSSALRKQFHLREAIVISGTYNYDTALSKCAKATANFLSSVLDNNMTLGVSWGRAIFAIANAIAPHDYYNINVAQMAGCLGTGNPNLDGLEISLQIAKKLNGSYSNIIAPVYVNDLNVYEHLISSPQIKTSLKKASQLDVVITGVGTLSDPNGALSLAGCCTNLELEVAQTKGVTGHMLARFMDIHGNEILLNDHYPISAPLSSLRNADWCIGVNASAEKAISTLSAINGKYINCLIVDEPLAKELLHLKPFMD